MIVDAYTINIIDCREPSDGPRVKIISPEFVANLMKEAEENLNLLLPEDYRVKIYRWDEGDEPDA